VERCLPEERIQFGPYELDLGGYRLTRAAKPVRLERIPMDLLILLARARGQLVTREEIIGHLWGNTAYVDTENGINTAVRKIRRALGDDAQSPEYIETVVGKGYRLRTGEPGAAIPAPADHLEPPRIMLAVLPFENLSGDPGQEYFSDGLTEETIARLGQMAPRTLGVIARTSAMAYKQTRKTVAQIGAELHVHYVLEGSVRRESEQARITAQLIRVQDQTHLWAESFDTRLDSILSVHGKIATAIADQVKLRLSAEQQRRLERPGTNRVDAHDDYLHGLFHMARVTYPELQRAIGYFRRASEQDPAYAPAYLGIADAVTRLPITSDVPTGQVREMAQAAIAKALELDPDSAAARSSDAGFRFWLGWDYKGAVAAARRAIELSFNDALAHYYLAHTLSNIGEHAEALAEIRRTLALDPFSLLANAMYGQFLYHAGRDGEAVEQLLKTLELEPRFWVAQICLAKAYERLGRHAEALQCCRQAWASSGGNTEALSIAGYVHAVSGQRAEAEKKIHELLARREEHYVPPYNIALIFAGLRDLDSALHWLEVAFADRDVHMNFLRDHKWDVLRSRREFRSLMASVGLPE
jgi:TolB-like protein/DNA-binding winged helix-turn-helix (wHTH) protein/Flp pilus assembly protein TadD